MRLPAHRGDDLVQITMLGTQLSNSLYYRIFLFFDHLNRPFPSSRLTSQSFEVRTSPRSLSKSIYPSVMGIAVMRCPFYKIFTAQGGLDQSLSRGMATNIVVTLNILFLVLLLGKFFIAFKAGVRYNSLPRKGVPFTFMTFKP